ncbi:MAG: hypothetical protein ABJA98_06040 [Acidobacteriota bacterium]
MPQGLTVLCAITPGQEERLRAVLRAIGNDIRGRELNEAVERPHVDFPGSRRIHFARFAILDDPDRGPLRKRLLYSSNYDGDLDGHLTELTAITSDLDAIWGACEGYAGGAHFAAFISAHAHQPEAFYIAFRDETVGSIQDAAAMRRLAAPLLDATSVGRLPAILSRLSPGEPAWVVDILRVSATATRTLAGAMAWVARALPIPVDLFRAVVRCGLRNVFAGGMQIIASLDRYVVFRLLNRVFRNHVKALASPYSSVELDNCAARARLVPGDEIPVGQDFPAPPTFREDVVTQNQLTLVTVVQPEQVDRVRAVMAAIDSYARRLSPRGSLIGISTIHFVRWVLIDNGRRLMLLSDYDGSWESYIDEFAVMILSGLDAIWRTSYGYPPDGAKDLPAFKRFLRRHQVPSDVFYSAYPDETVLNIVNDQAFAGACSEASTGPAGRLLRQV